MVSAVLYTDPACPWAYSAIPALRALEWRYGDQLAWRLVVIGLTEHRRQYEARGYTPLRAARSQTEFRDRFGMPFAATPKARMAGTSRACRAIVAARLDRPGSEWAALRALQLANFTTTMLLDDDGDLAAALDAVPGVDGAALVGRIDDADVVAAYERDREEARSAAGSAAELQGKTATTDGPVRFTAPSVVLALNGSRLVAGGWQPLPAYDVLVANLDPGLRREPPPEDPEPLLERFPGGLTTQEVAVMLASGNDDPDRRAPRPPCSRSSPPAGRASCRSAATPSGRPRPAEPQRPPSTAPLSRSSRASQAAAAEPIHDAAGARAPGAQPVAHLARAPPGTRSTRPASSSAARCLATAWRVIGSAAVSAGTSVEPSRSSVSTIWRRVGSASAAKTGPMSVAHAGTAASAAASAASGNGAARSR